MTDLEKLEREVETLGKKHSDYTRKCGEASQRKSDLESNRQVLLGQIADGDEASRRDLKRLDSDLEQTRIDEEAFLAAANKTATHLAVVEKSLARAEQQTAIAVLEGQIEALGKLDNELESALGQVKQKSAALFAATAAVAAELQKRDDERFNSSFAFGLKSAIKAAIHHRFEEMHVANHSERRPSFMERSRSQLEAVIAQLKYEVLGGEVTPERGERLFVTQWRLSGVRNLDLKPGSLIALTEAEASPFLANGSLAPADVEAA